MNCHLDALCQDINMLRRFSDPAARGRNTRHEKQIEMVKRTALQHGFEFKPPDRYRSAFIGEKPESVMALIDKCASQMPGIGATSYQMFSGVGPDLR
jgi:hypothetical protein